jgi:signal transduction histidine kinase
MWLNLEDVELGKVVEAVVERYRERAQRAGCELSLRTTGPVRGRWDRVRVEQIVESLLSNAIKFAPRQPIEVRVASDETQAELSVRDGGLGIAPADRQRIFQRFEQLEHPKQDASGLGLGLFLARELTQAHGGDVYVESDPGHGATFIVRLPLDRA